MKKLIIPVFTAILLLSITGCNETIDYNGPGKLVVKVTDAPFPVSLVESAQVTITKVEIRKSGDGIPDGSPFLVISEDTVTFDLLELRNGMVAKLLEIEIPAGDYNLIRLYVEEAGLKVKDGEHFNVKVPGGQQTGIKIFIHPGVKVQGGLTSEVLLDFDLSRSFVVQGNSFTPAGIRGFIFKPVIRAVNNSAAGRLEGFVSDTANVKLANASVWVSQDTIVATAITDSLGYYAIIGLPSGTWSASASKENYDTISYSGIKITAGNRTFQDFKLTPK